MNKNFKILNKYETLNHIKNLYDEKKRVVVSRYADGEYEILRGVVETKSARQDLTEELTNLLKNAINKEGQLVCIPNKIEITNTNLNSEEGNDKLGNKIARYIISNTNHNLYGQVQWRDIDIIKNNWEITTNFFVGSTLLITPFEKESKIAFEKYNVDTYIVPERNNCVKYESIKNDLLSIQKTYDNIVVY